MTITVICFILGLMLAMQLKTVKVNEEKSTTRTSEVQAQYAAEQRQHEARDQQRQRQLVRAAASRHELLQAKPDFLQKGHGLTSLFHVRVG